MKMKRLIPITMALFAVSALAGEISPKQAEMNKVIDQFKGKWKLDITAAVPGEAQKLKFPGTIDCSPIAVNSGVRCTISAKSDKLGTIVDKCLIAHDPEGTGV